MAREMYLAGVDPEELKPTPHEEPPKTPKSRWENYWYHYKWPTLAGLFIVVAVAFLAFQMLSKEKYDYTLVVVTEKALAADTLEDIAETMAPFGVDRNGDDEVNLQVRGLAMQDVGDRAELAALFSAGETMFFAFEPSCYQEQVLSIKTTDDYHFFSELSVRTDGVSEDGRYWDWKNDLLVTHAMREVPKSLYFGVRTAEGTAGGEKRQTESDACRALLEAYIQKPE